MVARLSRAGRRTLGLSSLELYCHEHADGHRPREDHGPCRARAERNDTGTGAVPAEAQPTPNSAAPSTSGTSISLRVGMANALAQIGAERPRMRQ